MSLSDITKIVESEIGAFRPIELGKIKIGGLGEERKSRQGRSFRMPRKDDHFTVTGMHRDKSKNLQEDTELMKSLIDKHGDDDGKLRTIPISLLSDNIDEVLIANYAWYGTKKCGARSDGKTVKWYVDTKTGKDLPEPIEQEWRDELLEWKFKGAQMFKLHAQLAAVIAVPEAKWGGVYKFRTTSIISFRQIYSTLVHISTLTGGVLMGMPLMLCVRPMQVAPEGKTTTVYVVHVELRGKDLQAIQQIALDQSKFKLQFREQIESVQSKYRQLLTHEQPDDDEYVQQEYHPEIDEGATSVTVDGELGEDLSKPLGFTDHVGELPEESTKPGDSDDDVQGTEDIPF